MKTLINLTLFLLIMLRVSCVSTDRKDLYISNSSTHTLSYIDEEFMPYVQEFIYQSKGVVSTRDFEYLTIRFSNLEDNVAGTCLPIIFNRKIEINRSWWDQNPNYLKREELIFHELGHCILFRGHTQPTKAGTRIIQWFENFLFKIGFFKRQYSLKDGCPASYMHPYTLSKKCIEKHHTYYMQEMFSHVDEKVIEDIEIIEEFEWVK